MTDWPQTLAICRRELERDGCCLGLRMKAAGWCSVDRHADKWTESGMEPPIKLGEDGSMKGEVLPPEGDTLAAAFGPDIDEPWTDEELERASRFGTKFRGGVTFFVECGEELSEARLAMAHGRFMRWIDECLPISPRSVRQFMQIARDPNIRRYLEDGKTATVAVLPADRLLLTEICGMEAGQFDDLVNDGVIHAEMRRGDLKRHRVQSQHDAAATALAAELPESKYCAILADPPWPFETRGAGGKGRSAENHYPTMTVAEICSLPIRDLAAGDAVLFLWVTSEHLAFAPALIEEWGFAPVSTAFVWVKDGAPGLGYWTRKGSEICLLGTRGSPRRLAADVAEVIHAPRSRHSEKPEEVYQRIERLVAGPYLELFARRQRPGWDAWGNDPALQAEAAE